jgi:hypothetical protein
VSITGHLTLASSSLLSIEGRDMEVKLFDGYLTGGFEIVALHRIGLQSASLNTRAIRLWKRLGFQQDGKDREAIWINGRWHDEVRFSILEGEWRAMLYREEEYICLVISMRPS